MWNSKPAFNNTNPFKKNLNGFTLLEILVALSIIALVCTSLLKFQAESVHTASSVDFKLNAPDLCRQLLTRIESDIDNFDQREGDFAPDFPDITWECDINEAFNTELERINKENLENLKIIAIKISIPDQDLSYQMKTWRLTVEETQ